MSIVHYSAKSGLFIQFKAYCWLLNWRTKISKVIVIITYKYYIQDYPNLYGDLQIQIHSWCSHQCHRCPLVYSRSQRSSRFGSLYVHNPSSNASCGCKAILIISIFCLCKSSKRLLFLPIFTIFYSGSAQESQFKTFGTGIFLNVLWNININFSCISASLNFSFTKVLINV